MNEKIIEGEEMARSCGDMKTVIRTVMAHALQTRPKKEVYFKPFYAMPGVYYEKALSAQCVDLNRMYPEAQDGDVAFVDFYIRAEIDYDIYLNVSGDVKVSFEGREVFSCFEGDARSDVEYSHNLFHIPLHVKAETKNAVRMKCVKNGASFGVRFLLSVKRYPAMWANDYLYTMRAITPALEYAGEEGVAVSPLFSTGEKGRAALEVSLPEALERKNEYQFPPRLPADTTFAFDSLCGGGDVCYVYTEACRTQLLHYRGTVGRILVNGKEIQPNCAGIPVQEGDKILFQCVRQEGRWFLSLQEEECRLSFLNSARTRGTHAVFVGPFYGRQVHPPEYEWEFSKVFMNSRGEKVYWRFCDGSQLRIYLDSIFFGQWFYALMIGFYGIRRASQILGDVQGQRLFCENMSFLAKYYDYVRYDIAKNTMPAFMPRISEMNVLDNIGTMGMNLIDGYFDSNDARFLPLIKDIAEAVEWAIPRFPDGTYYRVDTMWADDLYMSCPFLIRMGRLTGNSEWYKKAVRQIEGFAERLYIPEEKLFSHIFFPERDIANRVPWGRGNGWVMWTLSELLMLAEGKVDLSIPLRLFQNMAHAIRSLQDSSGLWRQVLNRSDESSYLETSCTAMFLLAFTRGVKHGWLKKDFLPCIKQAWNGLLCHSIDKYGNVYGVCMGSGCAMEAEYYFDIPTIINDDHGTGIVLAAASELYELLCCEESNGESSQRK